MVKATHTHNNRPCIKVGTLCNGQLSSVCFVDVLSVVKSKELKPIPLRKRRVFGELLRIIVIGEKLASCGEYIIDGTVTGVSAFDTMIEEIEECLRDLKKWRQIEVNRARALSESEEG